MLPRCSPPDDPTALAEAIAGKIDQRQAADEMAQRLKQRVRSGFSAEPMTEAVLAAYADALAARVCRP